MNISDIIKDYESDIPSLVTQDGVTYAYNDRTQSYEVDDIASYMTDVKIKDEINGAPVKYFSPGFYASHSPSETPFDFGNTTLLTEIKKIELSANMRGDSIYHYSNFPDSCFPYLREVVVHSGLLAKKLDENMLRSYEIKIVDPEVRQMQQKINEMSAQIQKMEEMMTKMMGVIERNGNNTSIRESDGVQEEKSTIEDVSPASDKKDDFDIESAYSPQTETKHNLGGSIDINHEPHDVEQDGVKYVFSDKEDAYIVKTIDVNKTHVKILDEINGKPVTRFSGSLSWPDPLLPVYHKTERLDISAHMASSLSVITSEYFPNLKIVGFHNENQKRMLTVALFPSLYTNYPVIGVNLQTEQTIDIITEQEIEDCRRQLQSAFEVSAGPLRHYDSTQKLPVNDDARNTPSDLEEPEEL